LAGLASKTVRKTASIGSTIGKLHKKWALCPLLLIVGLLLSGQVRWSRCMKDSCGGPMKALLPTKIAPPFAAYSHGVEVHSGHRLVVTSGQLALRLDGTVPQGAEAQARLCFENAFVTAREHMAGYMAARDAWLTGVTRLPASTLVIVAGFTRPEFLVEVEVTAAQ
jgi:enamine deaminase RidA (YjgF/YER057c/UK114 family)